MSVEISLTTFDIVKAISKTLKTEFPECKIYGEEVKQGLKAPAFTIFSIQSTMEKMPNNRYRRLNPFVIHYFPKDDIKTREECAGVAERMMWALEYVNLLVVNDTEMPLRGTQMHHEFKDDVMHFFVNYDVDLIKTESKEPMETLTETHILRE